MVHYLNKAKAYWSAVKNCLASGVVGKYRKSMKFRLAWKWPVLGPK
jgi:hypothetical protein